MDSRISTFLFIPLKTFQITKIFQQWGKIFHSTTIFHPNGDAIGQDDKAVIHRTERVLETFDTVHKSRVPPNVASKTADIYPIENVWSILKAEAQQHAPIKDIETLKRILNRKWRHISNDRNLCRSMIAS